MIHLMYPRHAKNEAENLNALQFQTFGLVVIL